MVTMPVSIQNVPDRLIRDRLQRRFELGCARCESAVDNDDAVGSDECADIPADIAGGTRGTQELEHVHVFVELVGLDVDRGPVDVPLGRSWSRDKRDQYGYGEKRAHSLAPENVSPRWTDYHPTTGLSTGAGCARAAFTLAGTGNTKYGLLASTVFIFTSSSGLPATL